MAQGRGSYFDDFVPERGDQTPQVKEAMAIVKAIEQTIDDLPESARERGSDFFESVLEKSKDIGVSIEKWNKVTDKQLSALNSMLAGVRKWVRD